MVSWTFSYNIFIVILRLNRVNFNLFGSSLSMILYKVKVK